MTDRKKQDGAKKQGRTPRSSAGSQPAGKHRRRSAGGSARAVPTRTLIALLAAALAAGGVLGAAVERSSTPTAETQPAATPGPLPLSRYDVTDRIAHIGQPTPHLTITDSDGTRVTIDHSDGLPRAILLVSPGCSACGATLAQTAQNLEGQGYDPQSARFQMHAVTIGGDVQDLMLQGWKHPDRAFTAGPDLLEAAGFSLEQLPAWLFTYPDGTLAGREQGTLDSDTFRRITTLLAATIP